LDTHSRATPAIQEETAAKIADLVWSVGAIPRMRAHSMTRFAFPVETAPASVTPLVRGDQH
jgi:hypothetical protein